MALLGVLSLYVGPAVAKSIFTYWLKDPGLLNSVASGIGTSLIDLIRLKTEDVFAQRRGEIQFDTIAQLVAEHLHRIIEKDGAHLSENEREAVASKVAETIEHAEIDPDLLVKRDLNPVALKEHLLRDVSIATRDFSADATEFYQDIIDECSQSIVDIASQLPVFNERTFAEVLKRERQIETIATRILEEVLRLREHSERQAPHAARFETEYRRAAIRQFDELELFGAEVSNASRRHRLSVAYVTLAVSQQRETMGEDPDEDAFEDDTEFVTMTTDEVLTRTRRLMLRGIACSGKTTLLKWIAVKSAQQSFEEPLTAWNNTMPFFIRLRQVDATSLPQPEDFPRLVAPSIAGTMSEGWVHDHLHSGRAIVLVDGVDEVPATQREGVQRWLRDLVSSYPAAIYVVSSRPHAIEEGWMASEAFDEAELQPMDIGNIRVFVDHWHRAVREALQDEMEKHHLDSLADPLKAVLSQSRQIRELATNPLLCAMLCALNRDRREQLPSDRIELYRACCEMLMERRDRERQIKLSDYPQLTLRQKEALLQDFAYWLVRNGWSEVVRQEADDRFDLRLSNMSGLSGKVTGEAVRRLFVDRTGLIREPVAGEIDFTHRTFQEYLASQAVLDEGDVGVLINNADNDQWREVVILAVGRARMKERGTIIRGLLDRGDREEKNRHTLHMLAVTCLETAVELDASVTEAVQAHLEALVPPKNFTEGKALASAGELAIPYLTRSTKKRRASQDAACVRALAVIGGNTALNAISEYANDERQAVLTEIFNGRHYFDPDVYQTQVFSSINQLKMSSIKFFNEIRNLTQLTSLNLISYYLLQDLSPLADLTQLTSLDLSRCDLLRDLSPLAGLTQLTSLDLIYCNSLRDLSPLVGLTQLTSLDLIYCNSLQDLSPLAGLTQLTSLDLSSCYSLQDLSPLTELIQLTSLDLRHCHSLQDLVPLSGLTQLTSLNLGSCSSLQDLVPLSGLTQLTSLDLSSCSSLQDLSPLAGLTQLEALSLSGCNPTLDRKPLAKLSKLRIVG